jgi:hypothetical protein
MLTRIMQALRKVQGPVDLTELSSQIEIDVSILEGMFEQLVRLGILRKGE